MNSHLRRANTSYPLFPEYWVHVGGHSLSVLVHNDKSLYGVGPRMPPPSWLADKITMALVPRARRYCVKPIASPFPCACRRSLLARDYYLEGAERRERSPNIRGLHAVLGSPTNSVYSLSPPSPSPSSSTLTPSVPRLLPLLPQLLPSAPTLTLAARPL